MNCWFCGEELIWQNDYTYEDFGMDEDGVVAILCCNNKECKATFEGYLDINKC